MSGAFGRKFQIFTEAKQGGRNYMEDVICVRIEKKEEQNVAEEYAYFGVFDGHGGVEAASFAQKHLLDEISKNKGFWTDDDAAVVGAIKDGFIATHRLMWKNVATWPKTVSGLPSTAGTTASVVVVRNGKIYVAHVGDSAVVIGEKTTRNTDEWTAHCVTTDHKPESPEERKRIEENGGLVIAKAGVHRVVWQRPRVLKGPIRRSTVVDNVPFLAVARALGDLWSYNSDRDVFVVSPEPDVTVYKLDCDRHECIVLASDGLWNMVSAAEAVHVAQSYAKQSTRGSPLIANSQPASALVQLALTRWHNRKMRADNVSAIVVLFNSGPADIFHAMSDLPNTRQGALPSRPTPIHRHPIGFYNVKDPYRVRSAAATRRSFQTPSRSGLRFQGSMSARLAARCGALQRERRRASMIIANKFARVARLLLENSRRADSDGSSESRGDRLDVGSKTAPSSCGRHHHGRIDIIDVSSSAESGASFHQTPRAGTGLRAGTGSGSPQGATSAFSPVKSERRSTPIGNQGSSDCCALSCEDREPLVGAEADVAVAEEFVGKDVTGKERPSRSRNSSGQSPQAVGLPHAYRHNSTGSVYSFALRHKQNAQDQLQNIREARDQLHRKRAIGDQLVRRGAKKMRFNSAFNLSITQSRRRRWRLAHGRTF